MNIESQSSQHLHLESCGRGTASANSEPFSSAFEAEIGCVAQMMEVGQRETEAILPK